MSGIALASDFDGDGRDDLAIGVVYEILGDQGTGAVTVLYGSSAGIGTSGGQFLQQELPWLRGDGAEDGDRFGRTLASGDFDSDGRHDLVVGSSEEGVDSEFNAGAVTVIYGGAKRLSRRSQFITQETRGVKGKALAESRFGARLAAGDFNGDGRDDLAISALGEDLGAEDPLDGGAVHVLLGGSHGLRPKTDMRLSRFRDGLKAPRPSETYLFGFDLAAGDFNRDGRDDLAIGTFTQRIEGRELSGVVHVVPGGRKGLAPRRTRAFHPGMERLRGPDLGTFFARNFGYVLAAGDLDGDRRDDLAVGQPHLDIDGRFDAGAVNVLYGRKRGLGLRGNEYLPSGFERLPGSQSERAERFGWDLAIGDLDNDGRDDLAVAAPDHDPGGGSARGGVYALYGSKRGVMPVHARYIGQDDPAITGGGEPADSDFFGETLTTANLNGRGPDELVIGEPEDFDGEGCAGGGAIHVLYPSGSRELLGKGYVYLNQDSPGMPGDGAESCDGFGRSLLVGAP